ncbi:transcriptional regulator GlxA family with amidase domain [Kineococcus xinjiangensis]|uniref:Transcriptional regulator GlxA family with amidase domain n=1 Tax=Kineococcus xinjiangensis TaxID=512762 RepID=A0A2S6IKG1_9ACTN|nr:transcriptional regulator GlxA family with amidase domain [Kineococcus xinjiangensis]
MAVLLLDGVLPLDAGIPAQVFSRYPRLGYALSMCGVRPGEVASASGFSFLVPAGLEAVRDADTVIVPGYAPADAPVPAQVPAALRAVHEAGGRVVSICTGAFALAATGLLDGRRATTHWAHAQALAEAHPAVRVEPDALYVDEGRVLTSAGVSAGIDLCLHLVRRDHGAGAANDVARSIVAAPHREGGQRQYLSAPVARAPGTSLEATRQWALQRLAEELTVEALARHACVSPRTFARRFGAETGSTPRQWLLGARLAWARELLESTALSVEEVAGRSGLGSAANLRARFRQELGTTPSGYRRGFGRG